MDVYEVVKSIGSGNFGQVYLVRHKYEGRNYVVKKIKTRDMSDKDRENTEQEVRLLQKLRHANIVAYKDSYIDREQYLNIVMIYCEGGDMYSKIKSAKGKRIPEAQIMEYFAQILMALLYLHDRKILHRDLKTQNIFLKNGTIRLGDFGIAKVLDGTRDFANTCIGTPYYMSPELFKNKPYSYKSDVWALGCVIYEMCNLRHAFDAQSLNGLAMKILRGSYPPLTPAYSRTLRDLVNKMLNVNPQHRPTLQELINVPLVKRHVVTYLRGCFSRTNEPGDVDDLNFDSLRDQAEKYGLMPLVNGDVSIPQAVTKPTPAELALREKEAEKKAMEEELKNIQQRRKEIANKQETVQNRRRRLDDEKANEMERNSRQKQYEAEKRREQHIQDKKRKAQIMRDKNSDRQTDESKEEEEMANNQRERVLKLKEQRRREEELKHNEELQNIRQQNQYNRQLAIEKNNAQFRTSSMLQSAFQIQNLPPESQPDNDFDSEEEDELMQELEQREQATKQRIMNVTATIEELRESLKVSNGVFGDFEDDEEDDDNSPLGGSLELVEEVEEEEAKDEPPTWQNIVKDRVKLLRHRCEAGLGHQLFESAYQYLQTNSGQGQQFIRNGLEEILSRQNIGYWALLDQLLFLESSIQQQLFKNGVQSRLLREHEH